MLSLPPQLGDLSAGEAAAGALVSGWEEGPVPPLSEALPGDTSGGGGGGQGCCTVYHEPGVLEEPHLYTDIVWPRPGTAGWWGHQVGRQPDLGLGAWGLGLGVWQRGGSPPGLSPLASLCSST